MLCSFVWLPHASTLLAGEPEDERGATSSTAERQEQGGDEADRRGPATDPGQASVGPLGFSGPSGVRFPHDVDASDGFLPIGDRWRLGFPLFDRLGRRQPADALTMGAVSGVTVHSGIMVRGLMG